MVPRQAVSCRPSARRLLLAVWAAALSPLPLSAQGSGFEASYGRWWPDSTAILYAVGYHHRLLGPFDWGVALAHVDDSRWLPDRTQTGGELTLGVGRRGRGLYATSKAGLAMRHQDGALVASWSAGLGLAVPVLPFLSLGLEATYRTEDQQGRGFWRLLPSDRRGLALAVRLATGSPPRGRTRPRPPQSPSFEPPSEDDLLRLSRERGASREGARLAASVVSTALQVMGTPYTWGGNDENGYDCSGLIQYAYGQHGIILPRVSRDQARMGRPVEQRIEALQPGDILGFSVERAGVTHVGLYVGEGRFIHSASSGVKISSLSATDPDSQWWRRHWVLARRILQ